MLVCQRLAKRHCQSQRLHHFAQQFDQRFALEVFQAGDGNNLNLGDPIGSGSYPGQGLDNGAMTNS